MRNPCKAFGKTERHSVETSEEVSCVCFDRNIGIDECIGFAERCRNLCPSSRYPICIRTAVRWGRLCRWVVGGFFVRLTIILVKLYLMYATSSTRSFAIDNGIVRTKDKRPIVNTAIVIGKAAGNIITSVSNSCSVATGTKSILRYLYVKCTTRRTAMRTKKNGVSFLLSVSSRVLRRAIIINCNALGGSRLINSIRGISKRILRSETGTSLAHSLRNRIPNLGVVRASNGPARKNRMCVQKKTADCITRKKKGAGATCSVKRRNTTLMLVSNIRNRLSDIGPSSIRDVSMLGSTSSSIICNTHTTCNMVLIAAGGDGSRGVSMGCGNSISFGREAMV